MNTSKLSKFAWAFFALVLGTATVFGQGRRNGNSMHYNQNQVCINQISDLSDDQKSKILEMDVIHQKEMAELRDERRSTTDAIEKNEIRGTMLKEVKAHRDAVKNLLTESQQKQFEAFFMQGNNYQNQRANGNFQGSKKFSGNCYGRGNQRFYRGCRGSNQFGNS